MPEKNSSHQQIFNPVLPSWEYVPDVEPRIFEGRLWLYGSHDRFNGGNFCMNDYVGWSAPLEDLSAWRYEGMLYSLSQDPLNAGGVQHGFAPDAIQGSDGRYYLDYCLNKTSAVSVAVSSTPAGPFCFYGHVHHADGTVLGSVSGDPFCFDPGLLMDGGRLWMYVGFAPSGAMRQPLEQAGLLADGCYCIELAEDMLTVKSKPELVVPAASVADGTGFLGHAFFEASSPRKINGLYYLIYSSEKSHELCCATAPSPTGPFSYRGTVISIGDIGLHGNETAINYTGNTHGGLVELHGQQYIFYHRQTNRRFFSRQCCAEPVLIAEDGSIPQVEVTSCGMNGGPLAGQGRYEARTACNLSSAQGTFAYGSDLPKDAAHPYFTQSGGDREQDGDQYIANLQNGAWAGFKYFNFCRARQVTIWVRGSFQGTVTASISRSGAPAAKISVAPSKDWTQCSAALDIEDGIHPLYFLCEGTGAMDFLEFILE